MQNSLLRCPFASCDNKTREAHRIWNGDEPVTNFTADKRNANSSTIGMYVFITAVRSVVSSYGRNSA